LAGRSLKKKEGKMPTICFTPTAYAKLLYMKKSSDMEVSGFGICKADNPLYITDFITVKQECTSVTTEMDADGLERYFEEMEEKGLAISQYFRIWIHTHPGMAPTPSGTDEKNFDEMFNKCSWAIMLICGKNEEIYARLRINKVDIVGSVDIKCDVAIDWTSDFEGSNIAAWKQEYKQNVRKYVCKVPSSNKWNKDRAKQWNEDYRSYFPGWHGYGNNPESELSAAHMANDQVLKMIENEQDDTVASHCFFEAGEDDAVANPEELVDDFEVLEGELKSLIDVLPEDDKADLINEIDLHYEIEYLFDKPKNKVKCQVLKGRLKNLIDKLGDNDKIWLMDEIDECYNLGHLLNAG
jgi:proteasome lid subunit RPN8/RPN11